MTTMILNRRHTSLRSQFLKVFILSTIPLLLLMILTNLTFLFTTRNMFEKQVESSTYILQDMIESQLDNSIRSYLRSKVEAAIDILSRSSGADEEFGESIKLLQSLPVGETGYFYAMDATGRILFHPDPAIVGVDLSGESPVREQLIEKTGYMEYLWQNTNETTPQPKALYMDVLPGLNWIITATSYRYEFMTMIDMESIQRIIADGTFGTSGYSFVIDRTGRFIAHPEFHAEEELLDSASMNEYQSLADRLFEQNEGYVRYMRREGPDEIRKVKIVYFRYLEDFDWLVGTVFNRSEIIGPSILLAIVGIVVTFIVVIFLAHLISRTNGSVKTQISYIAEAWRKGIPEIYPFASEKRVLMNSLRSYDR